MIKTESLTINGKQFTKTYSDENRYVVREGVEYSEAIDPSEFNRQYTEGNLIEETEAEAQEIVDILTGENE